MSASFPSSWEPYGSSQQQNALGWRRSATRPPTYAPSRPPALRWPSSKKQTPSTQTLPKPASNPTNTQTDTPSSLAKNLFDHERDARATVQLTALRTELRAIAAQVEHVLQNIEAGEEAAGRREKALTSDVATLHGLVNTAREEWRDMGRVGGERVDKGLRRGESVLQKGYAAVETGFQRFEEGCDRLEQRLEEVEQVFEKRLQRFEQRFEQRFQRYEQSSEKRFEQFEKRVTEVELRVGSVVRDALRNVVTELAARTGETAGQVRTASALPTAAIVRRGKDPPPGCTDARRREALTPVRAASARMESSTDSMDLYAMEVAARPVPSAHVPSSQSGGDSNPVPRVEPDVREGVRSRRARVAQYTMRDTDGTDFFSDEKEPPPIPPLTVLSSSSSSRKTTGSTSSFQTPESSSETESDYVASKRPDSWVRDARTGKFAKRISKNGTARLRKKATASRKPAPSISKRRSSTGQRKAMTQLASQKRLHLESILVTDTEPSELPVTRSQAIRRGGKKKR